MWRALFVAVLLLPAPFASAEGLDFDASDWSGLLEQHVHWVRNGHGSLVDYGAMLGQRAALDRYLARSAAVTRERFERWTREDQLAFLINLYNAATVQLVLTHYPRLHSIKDLGTLWRSPWKLPFIKVFGETYTLDDLEHTLILDSAAYRDPRVHFALNCASKGCPALRPEAYRGRDLDRQLEEQVNLFLGDRERNFRSGVLLTLSPVFRWYRSDFEKGWRNTRSLSGFLERYHDALGVSSQDLAGLEGGALVLAWSNYDWSLNGIP